MLDWIECITNRKKVFEQILIRTVANRKQKMLQAKKPQPTNKKNLSTKHWTFFPFAYVQLNFFNEENLGYLLLKCTFPLVLTSMDGALFLPLL